MPGPLTVADTVVDEYYGNQKDFGKAIAEALNQEVLSLANAGCRHIQIDEPLFARYPERALEFGVEKFGTCISKLSGRSYSNCSHVLWIS